nr:MAG TPA: hypothetical protein [Caudoviricetes sp.]
MNCARSRLCLGRAFIFFALEFLLRSDVFYDYCY